VIYPGSQAIIFNALLALTSPGDVVLTEALTFPGIKAAAARLDVRLVGVAMDTEGARPDALDEACRKHKPKAVYLVPTQQNPTTATMGPARRKAIADIIRKRGCVLIEDDVYGPLEPQMAPIATLIPEHTYYAASIAKCIAPALRVAYLLAPDASAEQRMRAGMQATMQMPPSLMVALVTQWLRSGGCRRHHPLPSATSGCPPAACGALPQGAWPTRRGRRATISGCPCRSISTAPTCCRI
jgi:DNA-binding transcriptional MocR family regulator